MHPLAHSLRSGAVAATAAAALLLLTAPAALAAGGSTAEVEVDHDCTSINVSSSKDISNVVLEFTDGDTQRFEDLPERRTGTFAGTGDNAGDVITTAWIKSGANFSGDGPGYGERFDFDDCAPESSTTGTTTDDGPQGPAGDAGPQGDDGPQGSQGDDGPQGSQSDDGPQGSQSDDGPQGSQGDDGPQGSQGDDGDQAPTVSDATDDSDSNDGNDGNDETDGDAANDSSDGTAGGETDGSTGTTTVASAVATAGDEVTGDTDELPAPRVLSGVLTATAEREAAGAVQSADADEIRSAGVLPNTGADVPLALAAALGALALGGGLLRHARRGTA